MSSQYGELRSLAAEIDSLVWGSRANYNGFRVLASLLQRRRSTYSAGRPSRWRLAHILVFCILCMYDMTIMIRQVSSKTKVLT